MKRKAICKVIIAIAVAMAFVMPVAFANIGTIGVTNIENTDDMENMVESTSDDNYDLDYIEDTIVTDVVIEKTIDAIPSTGKTIYVDDDADPSWYNETQVKTIQEGVNNATTGDTVYVYNGTYYELVTVYKQLDLIGDSRENTIIDGGGSGTIVCVDEEIYEVNISTFTIRNGKYGILLDSESSDNIVTNCDIYDFTRYGIYICWGAYDNTVTNCDIYNSIGTSHGIGIGLYHYSYDNVVTNCNIYNIKYDGIAAYGDSSNEISNCNIYNVGYSGIELDETSGEYPGTITNCSVYNCGTGISINEGSNNNIITDCSTYNNEYGITISRASNCELSSNTMYDNDYNFIIEGEEDVWDYMKHYKHTIDPTNTVDGKPIYYLVEQSDLIIDETDNLGYLGLISCTNITVKNTDVTGILVINTTDSMISNVSSHNSGNGIYLWMSSNNDIIDCNVYSNKRSCIFFLESSHNDIINCNAYSNGGGGVGSWRYGFKLYISSNNNITNCNTYHNNKGIYMSGSSNNIIMSCNVYNNSNGIIFEHSSNNIIMRCNVYNNSMFTWTGRGIYLQGSSNNDIINCNFYNNQYGIYLFSSKNCELSGNTIYDNDYNFVVEGQADLDYFHHVIDPTNTIDGKPIYYLVEQSDITIDETDNFGYLGLISCTNITAKNGDVTGILVIDTTDSTISNVDSTNCLRGIQLSRSSNNDIINCDVYSNAYGIVLEQSSNNNIANCVVYNSIYQGIYIRVSCSNNNIINCTIYNTLHYRGIYLHDSCSYNNIINCNVYNNGQGFRLNDQCSNNIITNCDIYNNVVYGIQILSNSIDNLIYHNNFVNNRLYNAQSSGNNQWDNGDEGNYWDDYMGIDEDDDGIGDTPYTISGSGGNQDRYPLMIPLDDTPPMITDVQATPEVQSTTEPVNITCTVTDKWGLVDTVKINITGPEGFALEVTMNEGSYYYEDVYTTMGMYDYFIWANDTNGNIATSDTYSFIITDFDMPTSAVNLLSAWKKAVPFDVTATAYDNTGVATVTLWYQYSESGTEWTDWTFYGTDEDEPWSWSFTGSDGYYEFYSIAIDDYGNVEDPPTTADASTGLDTVKPVTTIILDGTLGGNGWYISNVTVTLSATDTLSGVSSTWYRIDTGDWQLYSTPFTVSSDDEHIIQYYSFDIAGNREDANSIDVKIDKTPSETEHEFDGVIGDDGWFISNVTVTLSATDAVSGLNYTMYKLDDGTWMNYTEPFNVTEDGEYTLYYYSVDLAGNTETTKEVNFKIDHDVLPPVTTHEFEGDVGDNGWYTSNVVVTLTAEDDSAGVDYTMYKLDDDDWQKYYTSILVIEDGEHNITYYSVDKVGNREDNKSVTFKIDQTVPTIDLTAEKTGLIKWLLTAMVSDETSGVAKVEFYLAGEYLGEVTEEPYEWECSGKGPAQAIVYDNAGNDAVSEEVDVVSQSQSQSSSSTSVNSGIMPETDSTDLCTLSCYDAEDTDIALDTSNLGVLGDRFYAYNTYDPSGVLPEGPVYFDSENPGTITLLKETVSRMFISGGTWAVDTWYGCQCDNGWLWTIDEVNGTMTLIEVKGAIGLSGLAYDPTTDIMYGTDGYHLYIINMSSGNQTLVGPFNIYDFMIGIAFDGEGTLYGVNLNDNLYSINTLTGAATIIGPLGINLNWAQDMAFDMTWNILYLSTYTILPRFEGALYTCDVKTGMTAKVGTFQGSAEITGFAIPYTFYHTCPPEIPNCPNGIDEGFVDVEYAFSAVTIDPEEDQIYYMFDWGDGNYSNWLGPYNSGATVSAFHTWVEVNIYEVKVKAKDFYNRESDWSGPKIVCIVDAPVLEIGNISGGLFGIDVVIKNTGGAGITGITWNITLTGGFILHGKETSGKLTGISAHDEKTISSDPIFGMGKTVVTVTAETSEFLDIKKQDAFVLLFIIKVWTG